MSFMTRPPADSPAWVLHLFDVYGLQEYDINVRVGQEMTVEEVDRKMARLGCKPLKQMNQDPKAAMRFLSQFNKK